MCESNYHPPTHSLCIINPLFAQFHTHTHTYRRGLTCIAAEEEEWISFIACVTCCCWGCFSVKSSFRAQCDIKAPPQTKTNSWNIELNTFLIIFHRYYVYDNDYNGRVVVVAVVAGADCGIILLFCFKHDACKFNI